MQGLLLTFIALPTHISSSTVAKPPLPTTCKCKDKLTHYTSHYAPQFATPPYPFPSSGCLVREQKY